MELQKAEIVPGLTYRGRKVYLEQKGHNNETVEKDAKAVKQDCFHFALVVRELTRKRKPDSLIIDPRNLN